MLSNGQPDSDSGLIFTCLIIQRKFSLMIATIAKSLSVHVREGCRKVQLHLTTYSVFVRNCKRCTVVAYCQQLRTRDCEACYLSLHTKTEPIIEMSFDMLISSATCTYPSLAAHLQEAKLPVWRNGWSCVFDFSSNEQPGRAHWKLQSSSIELDVDREANEQGLQARGLPARSVKSSEKDQTVILAISLASDDDGFWLKELVNNMEGQGYSYIDSHEKQTDEEIQKVLPRPVPSKVVGLYFSLATTPGDPQEAVESVLKSRGTGFEAVQSRWCIWTGDRWSSFRQAV